MHFLLASSWIQPIVDALWYVLAAIDTPIKNYGWSLIILAALVRLVFWPLNTAQFKAMLNMQKIAPQLKKLQARYKDKPQELQQATMALYKEYKVNPLAGCWPMLVQYPVIISVYWVVLNHKDVFENQGWGWIGTSLAKSSPSITFFGHSSQVLAASLAHPDLVLIVLYALSMYLSVRFVSMPATDPQQAQTQKIMSIFSPIMLGFFGWQYQWPSAMVLYWFAYNVFTMAQQFYMLRRYHEPLSFIDSGHVITDDVALPAPAAPAKGSNGNPPSSNGTRKKKKNKKGA